MKPRIGGRAADKIDNDFATDQGPSPPVIGDVTEHPMFNLVPLAGSRREVANLDGQLQFIGKLLQLHLPEANAVSVAAPHSRR